MPTDPNTSLSVARRRRWPWPNEPRVEDPIRLQRFQERTASLRWAPESRDASLRATFEALNDLAHAELRYYFNRRQRDKALSGVCRFVAWLCGAVGLLLPLVSPVWLSAPANLNSWGYIAFGIAGSALVANSVFGGSEGHRRFVSTQLDIERLLTLFGLDWQRLIMEYEAEPSIERATAMLKRSTAFVEALHAALSSETALWGKQMAEAIADLEKSVQAGLPKKAANKAE